MPANPSQSEENFNPMGEVLIDWQMPSYPDYKRGIIWHIIASVIGLALLIQAVLSTNYVFAIIILIFAVIIALTSMHTPAAKEIKVTETGIAVGANFYLYRDIEHFSILYQPPMLKNLYLEFKSGLRPRITIDLVDQDPIEIRNHLLNHVKEDLERVEEPMSDFFGRLLKL